MICQKCVDTLIDFFSAETFVQNKIQDAGKNTDTHHFCCHSRTNPKGTAILLIVIHLSSSTPLLTTPQPLLPLTLELLSQKPCTAFHLSVLLPLSTIIFLSLCTQIRPVIGFLIVFPKNVLNVIINL